MEKVRKMVGFLGQEKTMKNTSEAWLYFGLTSR